MSKKQKREFPEGIDLLPSGLFRWRVTVGYRKGQQQRLTGTTDTLKQAKTDRAKAIADHERNVLAIPDKVTLREYTERWLEQQTHLADNTKRIYKYDLSYALEEIGDIKLTQIRPSDLKQMFIRLANRATFFGGRGKPKPTGRLLAIRTQKQVRSHLKAVFSEAVREQLLYINPADAIRPLKAKRGEGLPVGIALEFDQAQRFQQVGKALQDAGAGRLWTALFLCISLGLRRGEVMALRWCDIDFENQKLRVRQNLTVVNNKPVINDFLKTHAAKRDIPLPPSVLLVLEQHYQQMEYEASLRQTKLIPNDAVMATVLGTYTHPDNLERALSSLLKWSNPKNLKSCLRSVNRKHHQQLEQAISTGIALPKFRLHDLRHTAGTLMLRRGMRIEVVSKILGHARISITLDVYRHVLESEIKAEMVDLFPTD
ncbi:MAG: hypothetical protein RLZZ156_792 [Deinococcota bacterium]|jgi:integrase